jgi:hypothetical protein
MTRINFNCPHCNHNLATDASKAGMNAKCSKCHNPIVIPLPELAPAPPDQPEAPAQPEPMVQILGDCPYCRTKMTTHDRVRKCPTCETPHHEDCWAENKGCTVFGCSMAPPEEEKVSVDVNPGPIGPGTSSAARMVAEERATTLPYPHSQRTNAPGALTSVILGALGFFICGPIFGGLAISNANKAKKAIEESPDLYGGGSLATTGMVMGIVDLVGWAIVMLASLSGSL